MKNKTKAAIKAGELVVGVQSFTAHPVLIEAIVKEGFDFVVIDTEHTAYGLEGCAHAIRATKLAGATPIVRVYDKSAPFVGKALDMGAMGVVAPHVDSREEMEAVVRATRYPPDGDRGVCSVVPSSGFVSSPEDWNAYWRSSNEEMLVVALPLESLKGIQNVEEIISVPGLDLISLGVGDISQVLGHPRESNHPKVLEVRERVLRLCQKADVPVYVPVLDTKEFKRWFDKGVRVFLCAPDITLCQLESREFISRFKELRSPHAEASELVRTHG